MVPCERPQCQKRTLWFLECPWPCVPLLHPPQCPLRGSHRPQGRVPGSGPEAWPCRGLAVSSFGLFPGPSDSQPGRLAISCVLAALPWFQAFWPLAAPPAMLTHASLGSPWHILHSSAAPVFVRKLPHRLSRRSPCLLRPGSQHCPMSSSLLFLVAPTSWHPSRVRLPPGWELQRSGHGVRHLPYDLAP